MSWRLKRTRQCARCPWRKDVDPRAIPDGYTPEKHEALACTIAEPGSLAGIGGPLHAMACHETHESHCLGWLVNQLGPGNNIPLRLAMLGCENLDRVRLIGEQHERFEDTLPED